MKKTYLFFVFLFLTGCVNNLISANRNISINCPAILFGSEDKVYLGSSNSNISLENTEYRGEINNAIFSKKCIIEDNIFSSKLSILFILNPLVNDVGNINMPFYIAILDQNKKLQDMLFFSASGQFIKDAETMLLKETEVSKVINLKHNSIDEESIIVIGYILDEKRRKILD